MLQNMPLMVYYNKTKEHIVFTPKHFPTQRNHEIYDKKLLAIITGLEEFRKCLVGALWNFKIWVILQYFHEPQQFVGRIDD